MVQRGQSRSLIAASALLVFYVLATIVGALLFALIINALRVTGPGIFFYRGLIALLVTAAALIPISIFVIRRLPQQWGFRPQDSIGGSAIAASILLAAFVVGPVTVDRSISVFMLSQFERADHPLTEKEARDMFVSKYVADWDQIGRRLNEQESSGNLQHSQDGWRLTEQGRSFMRVSRFIASLMGTDPRFVDVKR
jgi:hypothetical protein